MISIRSLVRNGQDMEYCQRIEATGVTRFHHLISSNLKEIAVKSNVPLKVLKEWKSEGINRIGLPFMSFKQVAHGFEEEHYPTGCRAVDSFLKGGIIGGHVTQISGEEGCGKTQFCHSLSVSVAFSGKKVVYLDTESTLSGERMVNIIKKRYPGVDPRPVIDRMQVLRVMSPRKLFETLVYLLTTKDVSLVILDSILGVLVPHFNQLESKQEEKEQFSVIKEVVQLLTMFRARNPKTAIIVTNGNSWWFKKTWLNSVTQCLHLSIQTQLKKIKHEGQVKNEETSLPDVIVVRQLEVTKSLDLSWKNVGRSCFQVVITDTGFQDLQEKYGSLSFIHH